MADNFSDPELEAMTDPSPAKPEDRKPATGVKTVEQHRSEKKTHPWAFRAAQCMHAWGIGRELTSDEYDQAIAAVDTVQMG